MGLHSLQIIQCQNDISALEGAKHKCMTLRSENESLEAELGSLATSYVAAIKFEDAGSLQVGIKNLAAPNCAGIDAVVGAIDARIEVLSMLLSNYQRLDQEDALRRAEGSAGAS